MSVQGARGRPTGRAFLPARERLGECTPPESVEEQGEPWRPVQGRHLRTEDLDRRGKTQLITGIMFSPGTMLYNRTANIRQFLLDSGMEEL